MVYYIMIIVEFRFSNFFIDLMKMDKENTSLST